MNPTSIALSVTALGLLLCLFGPFRGMFLRRHPIMEPVRASGTNAIVVLIHGTFARGAKWTRADHTFLNHIESAIGPSEIHRLLWSGDNNQSQRISAADFVTDWLLTRPENVPIYLVGHSHGGAIAAMAATKVTDHRVRIVTLSTPFILVQPRHASLLPLRSDARLQDDESLLLFGIGLWVFAGILGAVNLNLSLAFVLLIMPILWLVIVVLGLQPWIERLLNRGVTHLREIGEQAVGNSLIQPDPSTVLILRTPGDEASGVLAATNLLAWAVTSGLRVLGRVAAIVVAAEENARRLLSHFNARGALALPLFFAAFVVPMSLGFAISQTSIPYANEVGVWTVGICFATLPLFLLLILRVPYLIVAPALTLLAGGLNFILTLPFGIDLAIRSTLITVSAEPTPIGTWPVTVSATGNSLLAHSALYESSLIEYALARFANQGQTAS